MAKRSFNSTLVQLKAAEAGAARTFGGGFQFYLSSIKSGIGDKSRRN